MPEPALRGAVSFAAMGRRLIMAAAVLVAASALGGCGGSDLPPAAEPAVSPPVSARPAGTVFRVGSEPEGLTVTAGGLAAVVTRDPSQLRFVDLARRRIVSRVALPATARHLGLGPGGRSVLVPVEQSDELIEARPGGVVRTIAVGDHPHDAASAAGRVFVGNEFGDSVSVVEGGSTRATLDAPAQPGGVAAGGGLVGVVGVADRTLELYDASKLSAVGTVEAGEGPTHIVLGAGHAYVVDTDGNAVLTYDLGPPLRLAATTPAPGAPYGIALDARRRRLWVTSTAENSLVEYRIARGGLRRERVLPTVRQPNSVAVEPGSGAVVVAGRADGVLEVIGGGA